MSQRELMEESIKDLEFIFRRYFRKLTHEELEDMDMELVMRESIVEQLKDRELDERIMRERRERK